MARTIKLAQIGSYMKGQVEQLLRATVLQTDTLLKQNSPVDTGRFRASWQIGENATGNYDAGPQQEPVNTNRSLTNPCLLYTSPSPRDGLLSRMPSSA